MRSFSGRSPIPFILLRILCVCWIVNVSQPAFAADPTLECTKTFSVTDTAAPGEGRSILSTTPAKLCAMDCLSTAANGWGAAVDYPDSTDSHAQAKYVAEKGAATSGDSTGTGETARFTDFGLMIQAVNSVCTGSWGS